MEVGFTAKNATPDDIIEMLSGKINALKVEQGLKILNEYRPRIDDPLAQALVAELFGVFK